VLGFNALRLLVHVLSMDENVHSDIELEAKMQSMAQAVRARMGKLADLIFHHGNRLTLCLTSPSGRALLRVSS
jgi:hypothetical protein